MKSDWQTKRLGEVALVSTGPFGSLLHKSDYSSHGVPFVNPINIQGERVIPDFAKSINEATKQRLSGYVLEDGDVVVGRRGEIGRCAVVGHSEAGWICGTGSFFIRPSSSIDSHFLAHLLRSSRYRAQLEASSTGATMSNLSNQVLGDLVVALPPLLEQKRIVAILDEAFEGINRAVTYAEKNLANARELFDVYLNAVFTQRGTGWVEKKLSEICSIASKLVDPRKAAFIDLPHLGAGNMAQKTGELIDIRTAREESLISGKFLFDETMVLYSKIRPYLKKACRPNFNGLCSADVYPLLPNATHLDRDFLFHMLMSQQFTDYAIAGSDRAGMPKVNRDHLFRYSVWLPAVNEQTRIASKLDAISAESAALEAIYQQKLDKLVELKQSILQKAFSGDLTAHPKKTLQQAAE